MSREGLGKNVGTAHVMRVGSPGGGSTVEVKTEKNGGRRSFFYTSKTFQKKERGLLGPANLDSRFNSGTGGEKCAEKKKQEERSVGVFL